MYDLKEILEQAKQDGQHNLIDIIKVTGLPPYELRRQFGKGLWKSICHNSKYRNKEISRFIKISINAKAPTNFSFDKISILNNMSTVKINQMICFYKDSPFTDSTIPAEFFSLQCVIEQDNGLDARNMILTVTDTIKMAKDLNQPFNPSWSAKRVKKEHDRLSILGREKSFGSSVNKKFEHAVDFENNLIESIKYYHGQNPLCRGLFYEDGFVFSLNRPTDYFYHYDVDYMQSHKSLDKANRQVRLFERFAYKITVLKTPKDYIEESNRMNHCIWSYAKDAQVGHYLAFHIDEYNIQRDKKGIILFNESFNKPPSKENHGFTLGARINGREERYFDFDTDFARSISKKQMGDTMNYKTRFRYSVEQVYGYKNSPIPQSLTVFLEFILSEFTNLQRVDAIKRFEIDYNIACIEGRYFMV